MKRKKEKWESKRTIKKEKEVNRKETTRTMEGWKEKEREVSSEHPSWFLIPVDCPQQTCCRSSWCDPPHECWHRDESDRRGNGPITETHLPRREWLLLLLLSVFSAGGGRKEPRRCSRYHPAIMGRWIGMDRRPGGASSALVQWLTGRNVMDGDGAGQQLHGVGTNPRRGSFIMYGGRTGPSNTSNGNKTFNLFYFLTWNKNMKEFKKVIKLF